MLNILFFSLGSNIGNRQETIEKAIGAINERIGTVLLQSTSVETEAWGFSSPNRFLNSVIKVETNLDEQQILKETQAIEKELGRAEKSVHGNYSDRKIDIDILFFNNESIKTVNLEIPHPEIEKRSFVLIPFCEIAPDFRHPVLKKTMRELLKENSSAH